MPSTANPVPSPDLAQAARFLDRLDPGGAFTFQTFSDSDKRPGLAKIMHGTLGQHAATLKRLNQAGAGIFVTVNQTDGQGRKAENVTRIRGAFVDLDGAPLEPVQACALAPHIITETSPGRWHCYWLVDDLPLDQFEGVQRAIAARFDRDHSVYDLCRVMRLPGFVHKKGVPFLTQIVTATKTEPYTAKQLRAEFPAVKGSKPRGTVALESDPILRALDALGMVQGRAGSAERGALSAHGAMSTATAPTARACFSRHAPADMPTQTGFASIMPARRRHRRFA
ncbi:MAG TPA: DNA-primase RepB domain-containing protein [Nitrococcus sp.]|nr:DNA-primase RepB domain-containing protein [Nitrococcus sp.]